MFFHGFFIDVHLIVYEIFVTKECEFLDDFIVDSRVIFDVGGNIGFFLSTVLIFLRERRRIFFFKNRLICQFGTLRTRDPGEGK